MSGTTLRDRLARLNLLPPAARGRLRAAAIGVFGALFIAGAVVALTYQDHVAPSVERLTARAGAMTTAALALAKAAARLS